jgi:hypothetical protein
MSCYGVDADELVHNCARLVAHGAVGGIGEGLIDRLVERVDELLIGRVRLEELSGRILIDYMLGDLQ